MIQQKVQCRPLNGLRGVALVLGVLVAAFIGDTFFSMLQSVAGKAASLGFILYGCSVAWFLLTRFVLGFVYTANDSCLRVCRTYGRRERFMCDVWFNSLLAMGSPEDMRARFPGAKVSRAIRYQCALAPLALAYKDDGKAAILIIQPDDTLRARLLKALRSR